MEDQLGVARNSKSKNEDGYYTGRGLPRVVAVGVPPASTGGALQLVLQTLGSEPTPPVKYTCLTKFTIRWKCPQKMENLENLARARARLNTQMNTIENANHIYIRHATSKV